MGPLFFKPGQELKTYEIYRKKASRDGRGRVSVAAQPELIDTVRGSISRASQSEQERWNQVNLQETLEESHVLLECPLISSLSLMCQ